MGIKKSTSRFVVFTSVFVGSILGAGITLLASPKSRDDTKTTVKDSIGNIRNQVNESLRHTTARLVETGAVLRTKTSQNIESAGLFSKSVKDRFKRVYNDNKSRKKSDGSVLK